MKQHKFVFIFCLAVTAVWLVFLFQVIWPVPSRHITAVRPDPTLPGHYQVYDSELDEWGWIGPAYHLKHRAAQEFLNVEIIRHLAAEDGAFAVLIEDPRSKLVKKQVWVAFTPDLFQAVNETHP